MSPSSSVSDRSIALIASRLEMSGTGSHLLNHPVRGHRVASSLVAMELRAAGFEHVEEIGRGGFGVVYRCAQVGLDRDVAIKVLTADADQNRQRFLREQRAMGRLTGHPNIVAVLHVGETESAHPYLVMPYHRRGCMQARIQRLGSLPPEEVLRLGVKMAGALESAHRVGIVHRDVKPANILLSDYDEPALSDFGIAHIVSAPNAPKTAFAGTPAFQAPEVLGGDPPDPTSDVYCLGATLFCALTGRPAFERRSGERVGEQLRRIATESLPNLRDYGVADDIATVVEQAMSRDPRARPSAPELGEEIRSLQARRGLVVDEMALPDADVSEQATTRMGMRAVVLGSGGRLPAPVATFVGRRAELSDLRTLLSTSRLVTLCGTGGVGKTALAMHAAGELLRYFADGVWRVELGDLHDGSLLNEVVAAALGIRDEMGRSQTDALIDFLREREALIVLDNCEHIIGESVQLILTLLEGCPRLRILATSREILDVTGESVLSLTPLTYPESSSHLPPRALSGYDAVDLFVERARAAMPAFTLTDRNAGDVARICARLEGVPLAIELAAARLRVMSPEQIAEGLSDRYALLNRGRRGAPARQQTLAKCMQWSYDLCGETERQLWGRLSVFAGSFDLHAAHEICGDHLSAEDFLEELSSLVDKSIVTRTEYAGVVRFRLLETLREYGWTKIMDSGQASRLRRRHTDWYRQFLREATANWFGPQQLHWIHRITREMPNIRDALQTGLSDCPETALEMAAAMRGVWIGCAMLNEGQRWLDSALAAAPEPTKHRLAALCAAALIANIRVDLPTSRSRTEEARIVFDAVGDPSARGVIEGLNGYASWLAGDVQRAQDCFGRALEVSDDLEMHAACTVMNGGLLELSGDLDQALVWYQKGLSLAESHGETIWRSRLLLCVGRCRWRQGQHREAKRLLVESLHLCHTLNDPLIGAQCLNALGWCAVVDDNPRYAAMLMAAAAALTRSTGVSVKPFAQLAGIHHECKRQAREELGPAQFQAAWDEGTSLTFEEAVGVVLAESDDE